MSVPIGKLPAQISPLGSQGISLDTRQVDCSQGIMTNVDDYLRPQQKGGLIRNFHQFSRGCFSSGGGGWQRDMEDGLNGGTKVVLDFGDYIDPTGVHYLLSQCGDTLYSYDIAGHAGTAISGMTALNATLLPCIRPNAPTGVTDTPFAIYCNGAIEPKKIYHSGAGAPDMAAALGFNDGTYSTIITVSGQILVGAEVSISISGANLAINPSGASYLPVIGDNAISVAAGLAGSINANLALSNAGVSATASGNQVTVYYPLATSYVVAAALSAKVIDIPTVIAGGDVFTLTFTSTAITGGSQVVTFTATSTLLADAVNGIVTAINSTDSLINVGIAAVGDAPTTQHSPAFISVIYPSFVTLTLTISATGASTPTVEVAHIQTSTLGGTIVPSGTTSLEFDSGGYAGATTISYNAVADDTFTSIAQAMAALMNASQNLLKMGVVALAIGNTVVTINPNVTVPITFTATYGAHTFVTAAGFGSSGAASMTFTPGSTTQVWPGVFNGSTYTKPTLVASFSNRVAYTGFAGTGASGNAVVFDLLISSLNDAEQFHQSAPPTASDAWAVTIPAVCGAPTALHSLKLNTNVSSEVLIIGCQNGMCIISGTDATSFNLQIYSKAWGVPSNRAFAELDNALIFLATDGFRIYTGQNNNSNLITDTMSVDFYDEFLKIDRTAWANAHAVHHRDTQEVWFWVPYTIGDGGVPQHAFVMAYNTLDGNPIWYFVDNTSCTASIEFNSTFYGGNEVGVIQKWYGCNNYDDAVSGFTTAENILPGAQLVFSLIGVGNPSQMCSINRVVIGASKNDQRFLVNASGYELMDDGSTRKQQQLPLNFTVASVSRPQTVLAPATPAEWTLGFSAFPQTNSKFLSDYVPQGHARFWEFSLACNDSSHNLDFTFLEATISIGGTRV